MNKFVNRQRTQRGVALALVALLLIPLIIFIAFSLNLGGGSAFRAELKNTVDDAASAGSMAFCSTRRCFNLALITALETIRDSKIDGQNGREPFVDAVNTVLGQMNTDLADGDPAFLSGPGGVNLWNFDGVRVEIDRGRWWKRTAPPSVPAAAIRPGTNFENFDGDMGGGVSWQEWSSGAASNQGTPSFFAANAVRVLIRRDDYRSSFVRAFSTPVDIEVESIASRLGKETGNGDFCAAPFAFPVCSLLNDQGEFDPQQSCQTDRYFTELRRYCTLTNNTRPMGDLDYPNPPNPWIDYQECSALPGNFFSPISQTYCDSSKPWYSQQRCECASSLAEPWVRGLTPCAQQFGHAAMSCHFYPWATFNRASDHYGVVGISETTSVSLDPVMASGIENWWQNLFQDAASGGWQTCRQRNADGTDTDVDGTLKFSIGNKFHFKKAGLNLFSTDTFLWRHIQGIGAGYTDAMLNLFHPFHYDPTNTAIDADGFTDMGWWWFMGRVDDRVGYPAGETTRLLSELQSAGNIMPTGTTIAPGACHLAGTQQWGTCGSKIAWYDNRCQREYRSWIVPAPPASNTTGPTADQPGFVGASYTSPFWGLRMNQWTGDLFSDPNGYAYAQQTPITLNLQGLVQTDNTGAVWTFAFNFDSTKPWNCANVPPHMPCAARHHDTSPSAPAYYSPENTRLWNTLVPIIADVSPGAQPCTGVMGNTNPDPHIDPSRDWIIVGFMRTYIYDHDIGNPPPMPPGVDWESSFFYTDPDSGAHNLPQGIGGESPPVCEHDTSVPWMFSPENTPPPATGTPPPRRSDSALSRPCNVVRARTACDPGIVGGDFHGMAIDANIPPTIVFAR